MTLDLGYPWLSTIPFHHISPISNSINCPNTGLEKRVVIIEKRRPWTRRASEKQTRHSELWTR